MWVCMLAAIALSAPAQTVTVVTPQPVVVQATGLGRAPAGRTGVQARLMAQRAAQVVAVRNLADKLGTDRVSGFRYLPATTLPDGWGRVTVEWPAPPVRHETSTVRVVRYATPQHTIVTRTTRIVHRSY